MNQTGANQDNADAGARAQGGAAKPAKIGWFHRHQGLKRLFVNHLHETLTPAAPAATPSTWHAPSAR